MITAQEWELLGCFCVEPDLLDTDPGIPWCYNDAAYLVELDGLTISFAIQPSFHDVRLIVRRGEQRIFELNSMGVMDVRVLNEPGHDILEVRLSEQHWLRVQLRPTFLIIQGSRGIA